MATNEDKIKIKTKKLHDHGEIKKRGKNVKRERQKRAKKSLYFILLYLMRSEV